jgi:hypothetical protein
LGDPLRYRIGNHRGYNDRRGGFKIRSIALATWFGKIRFLDSFCYGAVIGTLIFLIFWKAWER